MASHCSICCGTAYLPKVSPNRRDWFGRTCTRWVTSLSADVSRKSQHQPHYRFRQIVADFDETRSQRSRILVECAGTSVEMTSSVCSMRGIAIYAEQSLKPSSF